MALEKIVAILNQKIGLNPGSIGESSIARAVHHRIGFRNCINTKEYFELLKYDADEVVALIEEVVVPETWFFRNKMPFQAFKQHVVTELLPKCNKRKPIRILSIPCATGEEPYSLAITLIEAAVPSQVFRIDAVDVSKKALAVAKSAHYGKNSFRDVDPALREKYFAQTERGWQLDDSIRKLVKFKQGNILSGTLSPHPGYYDVIFCRNLLIYFDRKTQQQTLLRLYGALKKGAILFVGHAECSQVSDEYFQNAPYTKAFSFLKKDRPETSASQASNKSMDNGPSLVSPKSMKAVGLLNSVSDNGGGFAKTATLQSLVVKTPALKKSAAKNSKSRQPKNFPPPMIQSLRPAEKLANEGRYEEAQKLCTVFLEQHPESAHGHYLLGLIKNAQGDQKAAESLLKKAIYLDPNHEPALVLSCLLAEQKGDVEAVQSFKRRIERVKTRNRPAKS